MQDQDIVKQSYLVVVKVLEARDLKGESSGDVNPYVQITCGNLEPQKTKTIQQTANCIWNQSFTFPDLMMNRMELETFELNFEVQDQNSWFTNSLVGSYSVGLSTMYRCPNSEIYKKWLRISKPEQPTVTLGYIQISAFIVGPGQEPPVHDANDIEGEEVDAEAEQMIRDGFAQEAILEKQKLKQGLWIVNAPRQNWLPYQLMINVYKAENLCKLADEETNPSAFVSVRSQGCMINTKVKNNMDNPNWNQKVMIPVYIPTFNEKIKVSVWHQDGAYVSSDVYIGSLPERPNAFDELNIAKLHSKEGAMDPTWFNLYGIRPKELESGMSRLHSSSWLGRVLMSIHLNMNDKPLLVQGQSAVPATPKTKNYKLWLDLFELVNCEYLVGEHRGLTEVTVQAFINGKCTSKKVPKVKENGTSFEFGKQSACQSVDLVLPEDRAQIPDLFININLTTTQEPDPNNKKKKGEVETSNRRLGFIRLEAKKILTTQEQVAPTWHFVKSIQSADKHIGRLLLNARLVDQQHSGAKRQARTQDKTSQYWFFPQIFSGYELAPNYKEEDVETRLRIEIGQKQDQKKNNSKPGAPKVKQEIISEIKLNTFRGRFPEYNYFKEPKKVNLSDEAAFAQDMKVQLILKDKSLYRGTQDVTVGQFLVPISCLVDKIYKRPQYFNLIDSDGKIQGKILARFFLLKRDPTSSDDNMKSEVFDYMMKIMEEIHQVDIKVSVLGIRSMLKVSKTSQIKVYLTNSKPNHGITVMGAVKDANKKKNKKEDSDENDDENPFSGTEGVHWNKQTLQYELTQMQSEDGKAHNPNYGRYLCFEKIKLKRDMLLWPNIVFQYYEYGFKDTPEPQHLVLPTFLFCDFLKEQHEFQTMQDIKVSLGMLMENTCIENQRQQNPLIIFMRHLMAQIYGSKNESLHFLYSLKLVAAEEVYAVLAQQTEELNDVKEIQEWFEFSDSYEINVNTEEGHKELVDSHQRKRADGNKGKKNKDDGDGDDGDKKGKGQKDDNEDSGSDDDFEPDTFTDMKQLWRNFKSTGGGTGDAKGEKAKDKNMLQDNDGQDKDQLEEEYENRKALKALNLSPFEEDPVNKEFQLHTTCEEKDKKNELKWKKERITQYQKLYETIRKIQDSLDKKEPDFADNIRAQLMMCRQKIQELRQDIVDEDKFEQHNQKEEQDLFDYGRREISHKPLEMELDKILPFFSLPLFEQTYGGVLLASENASIVNGVFSTGQQTTDRINFAVSIQENKTFSVKAKNRDEDDSGSQSSDDNQETEALIDDEEDQTLNQRISVNPYLVLGQNNLTEGLLFTNIRDLEQRKRDEDNLMNFIKEKTTTECMTEMRNCGIKVDIFRPDTLAQFVASRDYVARIFIKGCQNLSAVDNRVNDIRNQLAGDRALSSADPFLMLRIMGEEENLFLDGYDKVQEEALSPQFFEQQEVTNLRLQTDWRLEIEVRDKSTFRINETVIGMTMIDLETRRWANHFALAKLALEQEIEIVREQQYKHQNLPQAIKKNNKELYDQITRYLNTKGIKIKEAKDNFGKKEQPLAKAEFRPLKHPNKNQSQGLVELFVDVLDPEEARSTNFQKLKEAKKEEMFEVRLIIWETRECGADSGAAMNVQIKASYQKMGLTQEPIVKATDEHKGCKDGRAVFNWRMIFQIQQDEFPRLKLQLFDTGLGGDLAIGETILNLSTSIKLLQKVGTLEDKKIWCPFNNPQNPESNVGYCLIQLQVLHQTDADNDPRGEAQLEPNMDPKLTVPTVGRSWGDAMAGLGLALPDIALPDMFGMIKKVIIAVMIAMALFFVMFLILASK